MRVRAFLQRRPATSPAAAASPRRSPRTAAPPVQLRLRGGISPERIASAGRSDQAIRCDHLFVHSCRYLELTIFYRATVIERQRANWAGTPFALWLSGLQWRSGE